MQYFSNAIENEEEKHKVATDPKSEYRACIRNVMGASSIDVKGSSAVVLDAGTKVDLFRNVDARPAMFRGLFFFPSHNMGEEGRRRRFFHGFILTFSSTAAKETFSPSRRGAAAQVFKLALINYVDCCVRRGRRK